MTKPQKLAKMQELLNAHGVMEWDAEVLAEDLYTIAVERGGNFQDISERLSSAEEKIDVLTSKLDRVAKRLG